MNLEAGAWVFTSLPSAPDALRRAVREAYRIDESDADARILAIADRANRAPPCP